MNTPVNNSLDQALAVLTKARNQAATSHDWHTYNKLTDIFAQVVEVKTQTTETQIASVDGFIKNARNNGR